MKNDFINEVQKLGSNFTFPYTYYVPESKIPNIPTQKREQNISTAVEKAIKEAIPNEKDIHCLLKYQYHSFYNVHKDKYTDRRITVGYIKLIF